MNPTVDGWNPAPRLDAWNPEENVCRKNVLYIYHMNWFSRRISEPSTVWWESKGASPKCQNRPPQEDSGLKKGMIFWDHDGW